MVELTPDNFMVVTNPEGEVLTMDKNIYLQNKSDGALFMVEATNDLCEIFNIPQMAPRSPTIEEEDQNRHFVKNKKSKWSRESILKLIELRMEYDKQFKSTSCKNEVIWRQLAEELERQTNLFFTPTQCNDKWRYLKAKYTSKKDNMGDKGSGESPVQFEYFEVMDEFLGQKHNIKPIAVGSSLRGDTTPNIDHETALDDTHERALDDTSEDPPQENPLKKQKLNNSKYVGTIRQNKTGFDKILDELQATSTSREENRERRHKEQLEARNNAVNVFSDKMDKLLENFKK